MAYSVVNDCVSILDGLLSTRSNAAANLRVARNSFSKSSLCNSASVIVPELALWLQVKLSSGTIARLRSTAFL